MGMTIAEKILAAHSGRDRVRPGDLLFADLDLVMGTDVTVPMSVDVFGKMGATRVFDPEKVVLVNDHFVPAKDVKAAELSKTMREFAKEQHVRHYFEVGRSGICHIVVPDSGLVKPGDLVIGADSHTCTYGALGALATGVGSTDMAAGWALGKGWFRVPATIKVIFEGELPDMVGGKDLILLAISKMGVDGARYQVIEFAGPVIDGLPMADRFTMANMAVEAGAKSGIMAPDDTTRAYLDDVSWEGRDVVSDSDATYSEEFRFDVSDLAPMVAKPYLPSNAVPVTEVAGTKIDQVVIGSCTNGRMEDFRAAWEVMGKHQVHPDVRLIVIPSSPQILGMMIREGILEGFVEAGAVISPPTCGPCIGGHMGILAAGEVGLYTTNRNFVGRNGHPSSKVYLSGPRVAAASAIAGCITDPREVLY
jgi:3-isopropylmalate/(R)-2-methylmalate dehydratase large subunit